MKPALLFLVLLLGFAGHTEAQTPEWIWSHANSARAGEVALFRKVFTIGFEPREARLIATGDDEVTVFLNGKEVGRSTHWKQPINADVTSAMHAGTNVLAARGKNTAPGAAAILVKLEVRSPNMFGRYVLSDASWLTGDESPGWQSPAMQTNGWRRAVSLGKLGIAPWGDALQPRSATPAESLTLLPGLKAELLHSARHDEGSWIAMCSDDKGRLILSPEKTEVPLLRVTLSPSGRFEKIERLASPLRGAMGLCYAYDSLYVNGRGPNGVGLYRLIDSNRNDQFDPGEEHLLKHFEGDNEHGYHAVVPGPDGAIYVMNGNHTKVPSGMAADSPYRSYAEDQLLPQQWDANGHAKGVLAPGGYILRTDAEGKEWRLMCGGFRNTYDFDFAPNGEIFTFDSDMEWDIGAPWYRPTRILHCVSGGEYGWRSGTRKWPAYYPDSLPSAVDIGLSSPTGVKFGTKSNFPETYRRALYAADWAYGKIFAVHLEPRGASYSGTFETFVSGKPLAVSAMTFGKDGALYFILGGWKIQSGLYRISWSGNGTNVDGPNAKLAMNDVVTPELLLRRKLESFHGRKDPAAGEFAWPRLASDDRWLRYAARVAIEFQDVGSWQQRAVNETNVNASLTALLALARVGERSVQNDLLKRLAPFAEMKLAEEQTLDALRVLQVCFTRMGKPDSSAADFVIAALSRMYPAKTESVNRELCQLLVYLEAPDALPKTLALMNSAFTQEEQMHYAFVLRNVKRGWTMDQRRSYFAWFNKALREFNGGASFKPFLKNIRKDAVATLTPAERNELAVILEDRAPAVFAPRPREFVKAWSLAELEPALMHVTARRSFARGKQAFIDAQCIACHRAGAEGGAVGPDLTGISGRFNHRDLLDNILSPSKIISDRYQSYTIETRDGEEFTGCITDETNERLVLIVNPIADLRHEIAKKDIVKRSVAKTSAMPEGLLNVLSRDEILDLLAFIEADAKPGAAAFATK
jgi:putative heme-binding domain-containing protein